MRGDDVAEGPVHFPYVRTRGPVALIGLNSAVPTPPFVAAGRLGREQLTRFADCLEEQGAKGMVRVVMIHHPPLPGQCPPRRALADAAAMADVLDRCGAELVLHGHNHKDMLAWRTHSEGGVPVLGVASASSARVHKGEPLGRYHLLRIRREGNRVRINCETRGITHDNGGVVSLNRHDLVMPAP
jgi:3',5'-cyclic AMP phosphodiesterase CpdA